MKCPTWVVDFGIITLSFTSFMFFSAAVRSADADVSPSPEIPMMVLEGDPSMPPPPSDPRSGRNRGDKKEDARHMMEALKIWKVTQELDVDEALSEKLYPRLRKIEKSRFENDMQNRANIDVIKKILETKPLDAEKLKQAMAQFQKERIENEKRLEELQNSVLELLNVEQQARYLVIEEEFPRQIRDYLRHRNEKGHKQNSRKLPLDDLE